MKTKIFNGKKITIRPFLKKDLYSVKKFQRFINELIEEGVMISRNKEISLKEETNWLKDHLKKIQERKEVFLIAGGNEIIIGVIGVTLGKDRQSHVGNLEISIKKEYRRIGLGKYLMAEIIKLAKKELKPKSKIIRLSVLAENKPAIKLYKKFGFQKVSLIPDQIKYKGKLHDEIIMLLYS